MGPSGRGKTTLLRLIAGLEKPDRGNVAVTASEAPRISVLFQEDRLLPDLSAISNIRMVLESGKISSRSSSGEPFSENTSGCDRYREDTKRILSVLSALRLTPEEAVKPVRELSGGMQRRVAIARTLLYGGNLYLFDEPFKGLDEATRASVISFVREYTKNNTVILVTHDEAEAELFGGQIYHF